MSESAPGGGTSPAASLHPQRGWFAVFACQWKNWIPVLLWMLLIFSGSSDLLSSRNTYGVLNPLLHWFYPSISPRTVYKIHHYVRKAGHVSEYAILAILLWRALPDYADRQRPLWRRRKAALVLGAAILYACSDEFHQRFIPSRTGAAGDVGFDACGAVAGLIVAWAWDRRNRSQII